jgi:hypothetical protein
MKMPDQLIVKKLALTPARIPDPDSACRGRGGRNDFRIGCKGFPVC